MSEKKNIMDSIKALESAIQKKCYKKACIVKRKKSYSKYYEGSRWIEQSYIKERESIKKGKSKIKRIW